MGEDNILNEERVGIPPALRRILDRRTTLVHFVDFVRLRAERDPAWYEAWQSRNVAKFAELIGVIDEH